MTQLITAAIPRLLSQGKTGTLGVEAHTLHQAAVCVNVPAYIPSENRFIVDAARKSDNSFGQYHQWRTYLVTSSSSYLFLLKV